MIYKWAIFHSKLLNNQKVLGLLRSFFERDQKILLCLIDEWLFQYAFGMTSLQLPRILLMGGWTIDQINEITSTNTPIMLKVVFLVWFYQIFFERNKKSNGLSISEWSTWDGLAGIWGWRDAGTASGCPGADGRMDREMPCGFLWVSIKLILIDTDGSFHQKHLGVSTRTSGFIKGLYPIGSRVGPLWATHWVKHERVSVDFNGITDGDKKTPGRVSRYVTITWMVDFILWNSLKHDGVSWLHFFKNK